MGSGRQASRNGPEALNPQEMPADLFEDFKSGMDGAFIIIKPRKQPDFEFVEEKNTSLKVLFTAVFKEPHTNQLDLQVRFLDSERPDVTYSVKDVRLAMLDPRTGDRIQGLNMNDAMLLFENLRTHVRYVFSLGFSSAGVAAKINPPAAPVANRVGRTT